MTSSGLAPLGLGVGSLGVSAAGASGEVPRSQRRAPPKPLSWFSRHYAEPHEAMARAHLEGGHSQAGVARHFGVHYSTVSRAAARFAGRAESG